MINSETSLTEIYSEVPFVPKYLEDISMDISKFLCNYFYIFFIINRTRLRIQHLVEKEKLVLAVEQEILRVHGRAERAVANQVFRISFTMFIRLE